MWRRKLASLLRPSIQSSSPSSKSVANLPPASQIVLQPGQTRHFFGGTKFAEVLTGNNGQTCPLSSINNRFAYQLIENRMMVGANHSFIRSLASRAASDRTKQGQTEQGQKAISTAEDPFDSPTYHIPEKPVTFTEGASYGVVILAGFGIAAAAAYAVFKELIFEPKEYKIFNKALERIQNDGQVRVRIGAPIKGYGQESRNRAARQRIPHRTWTDADGTEHIEVNFHIRGPHGGGKVYCEMFKDKTDGQWKFMYLLVDILQPSPKQLILESFLPA